MITIFQVLFQISLFWWKKGTRCHDFGAEWYAHIWFLNIKLEWSSVEKPPVKKNFPCIFFTYAKNSYGSNLNSQTFMGTKLCKKNTVHELSKNWNVCISLSKPLSIISCKTKIESYNELCYLYHCFNCVPIYSSTISLQSTVQIIFLNQLSNSQWTCKLWLVDIG